LVYYDSDSNDVFAGYTIDFQVRLDMPGNADGSFAERGYYVSVFLWESSTCVPVSEKFVFPEFEQADLTAYITAAEAINIMSKLYEGEYQVLDDACAIAQSHLNDAIIAAKTVSLDATATQSEIFNAVIALSVAIEIAEAKIRLVDTFDEAITIFFTPYYGSKSEEELDAYIEAIETSIESVGAVVTKVEVEAAILVFRTAIEVYLTGITLIP
jgi:hypothetical protein